MSKSNHAVNRTGAVIPYKLKCLGHYGYGSGWLQTTFCVQCPLRVNCIKQSMSIEGKPIRHIEVVERQLGGGDRVEGTPRYVGVPQKGLSNEGSPARTPYPNPDGSDTASGR